MRTRQVAHLEQSEGVVTRTLHLHPPSGVAEQVEPFAWETSVAVQVPNWNPASHACAPKS